MKYISNRVKVNSHSSLSTDRYKYLALNESEPNLGIPGEKPLPLSSKYYNLITIEGGTLSDRYWREIPPLSFTGGISIFDEGFLVGTANSVSKINFVGAAISAIASGDISTITVYAPGSSGQIVFNNTNDFSTDSLFVFNPISNSLGIGTTNALANLHVQGSFKLTESLTDYYNNVGAAGSILISTGIGVSWSTPFASGLQGTQGTQGLSNQGVQGRQGTQGLNGLFAGQGIQGTQGVQGITGAGSESFVAGTVLLFYQANAPTGWTKVTTQNNKALRVVSGTGGGTGGSTAFTSVFTSRTPSGSVSGSNSGGSINGQTVTGSVSGSNSGGGVNAHTLSTNEMPSHKHNVNDPGHFHTLNYVVPQSGNDVDRGTGGSVFSLDDAVTPTTLSSVTGITLFNNGSSNSHSHGFTNPSWSGSISMNSHSHGFNNPSWSGSFSGSSMDFAVQYIDVIICSKN